MISLPRLFIGIAIFVVAGSLVRGQITFGPAQAITGSDNIISAGTFVDALQTAPGKSTTYTIGDNVFNVPVVVTALRDPNTPADGSYNVSESDSTFTLAPVTSYLGGAGDSFNGTFTTGNTAENGTFRSVLATTAYTEGTMGVTINNLTLGNTYEVQVFKSVDYSPDTSRNTAVSGANTVQLDAPSFTVGTFTATGSTQMFTFSVGTGGDYGEANALVLRDLSAVPESSTYGLVLGGLGFLTFLVRRQTARA